MNFKGVHVSPVDGVLGLCCGVGVLGWLLCGW